jgi:hypothetical protein
VLVGDGGGKVPSILNPVYGFEHIVRFFRVCFVGNATYSRSVQPLYSGRGMLTFRDGQLVAVVSGLAPAGVNAVSML